jgi:hypothetical protein
MKRIRSAFAASLAVTGISVAACSSELVAAFGIGGGSEVRTLSTGQGQSGSVGMTLTIGNGVHINSLNWTLANGTNTYSGTIQITDDAGNEAQSVEFVAGGIQAGSGYTVTLSGSDTSGDPCSGTSAPVTVMAGATSAASVLVTCTVPTNSALASEVDSGFIAVDAGVVLVNQPPFACPGITGVSVSPAEIASNGQIAALTGTFTGSNGGVQTLLWSTDCTGAILTNPTSPDATFACGSTQPGTTCHVTLTVGLDGTGLDGGSVGQVCTGVPLTTTTETINCEMVTAIGDCFAPTIPCFTDGGQVCTNLQTDPNNCGACGHVCAPDSGTPVCSGGTCTAQSLTCSLFLENNAATLRPVSTTCTPTEQMLFDKDTTGSCLACAFTSGCLDDTSGDSGQECADPLTTFGTQAECIAVLECDIGLSPAISPAPGSGLVLNAYCGLGTSTSTCEMGGPLGACASQIAAGFPPSFTPTQIVNNIAVRAYASGMADAVVACIDSSTDTNCTKCLQ